MKTFGLLSLQLLVALAIGARGERAPTFLFGFFGVLGVLGFGLELREFDVFGCGFRWSLGFWEEECSSV